MACSASGKGAEFGAIARGLPSGVALAKGAGGELVDVLEADSFGITADESGVFPSSTGLSVDGSGGGVAKLELVGFGSGVADSVGATLTATAICSTILAKLFIVPWMLSMEVC